MGRLLAKDKRGRSFQAVLVLAALLLVSTAHAADNQVAWRDRFILSVVLRPQDQAAVTVVKASVVDRRGDIYVGGDVFSFRVEPQASSRVTTNGFLRKYTPKGEVLWTKTLESFTGIRGPEIDEAGDRLYVVGTTSNILTTQRERELSGQINAPDAFIRRYGVGGGLLWTRQFGSSGTDEALGVTVGAAGNIIIVGVTDGALPGRDNAGLTDAFVRKYSPRGGIFWTRQFGTPGFDEAAAVAMDSTGRASVVGSTQGRLPNQKRAGGTDGFVRQYSPRGGIYWTRQFGRRSEDKATAVAVDSDGRVYVGGKFGINGYVRRFDSSGRSGWYRAWRYTNVYGVVLDSERKVYVVGDRLNSAEARKAMVRKLGLGGEHYWFRDIVNGEAYTVAVDAADSIYIGGEVLSVKGGDGFVVKLD